jgi:hypothetical protein
MYGGFILVNTEKYIGGRKISTANRNNHYILRGPVAAVESRCQILEDVRGDQSVFRIPLSKLIRYASITIYN